MKDLNVDIIHSVLRYTNINKIVKTCLHLNRHLTKDDLSKLVYARKNPRIIFTDLFGNTEQLLKTMQSSGCFLAGLRAIDFFRPVNIQSNEPWKFYCQYHPLSYLRMLKYLESIGVMWSDTKPDRASIPTIIELHCIIGYKYYKGIEYSVIIHWRYTMPVDALSGDPNLLIFPQVAELSSLSYCMIMGSMALAPYSQQLFNNQNYIWADTVTKILSNNTSYGITTLANANNVKDLIFSQYEPQGFTSLNKDSVMLVNVEKDILSNISYVSTFEKYFISDTLTVDTLLLPEFKSTNIHKVFYYTQKSNISLTFAILNQNWLVKSKFENELYNKVHQFSQSYNIVSTMATIRPRTEIFRPKYLSQYVWIKTIQYILEDEPFWICY